MRPIEDEATEDILPAVLAAASRSPDKLRDTALVLVVMGTSLAPIEIALLRVDDFLNADSSIKHRSVVRAEIALNRKERPLHWVNARICKSISRYLSWRVQQGFDVTGRAEFRGLNPDSALFLTTTGLPMKVRERPSPRGAHRICATIQSILHRLFVDANVAVTARDGRRRFAERLYTMGGDVLSHPAICSGDHCSRNLSVTMRAKVRFSANLQRLGRCARSQAAWSASVAR